MFAVIPSFLKSCPDFLGSSGKFGAPHQSSRAWATIQGDSPQSTRRAQSHRAQPIMAEGFQEQTAKDAMDAKGAKDWKETPVLVVIPSVSVLCAFASFASRAVCSCR